MFSTIISVWDGQVFWRHQSIIIIYVHVFDTHFRGKWHSYRCRMPIVMKMIWFIHRKCVASMKSIRWVPINKIGNYLIYVTSSTILIFQISNLVDQMRQKKINCFCQQVMGIAWALNTIFPFLGLKIAFGSTHHRTVQHSVQHSASADASN